VNQIDPIVSAYMHWCRLDGKLLDDSRAINEYEVLYDLLYRNMDGVPLLLSLPHNDRSWRFHLFIPR